MSLKPSVVGRGYSGNAKSTRATFRLFDRIETRGFNLNAKVVSECSRGFTGPSRNDSFVHPVRMCVGYHRRGKSQYGASE
jgi:hypothetical protein